MSSTTTSPAADSAATTVPSVPQDDVATHDKGSGGSNPLPLVIGGLIAAALVVAAYIRSRRNPRTP
jgi:hypothetical protein